MYKNYNSYIVRLSNVGYSELSQKVPRSENMSVINGNTVMLILYIVVF